jgi:CxxC-x17-CxxC domain-containing protein
VPSWVDQTAHKHLNQPATVKIAPEPGEAAQIEHVACDVANGDKMAALEDLLDHRGDGSVIVFGRTKHGVNKLAKRLQASGYPVAALQGNLSQNARDRVMDDFRNGEVPVLVATNVAARGLDVSHVAQVINVELPESPELLTHRIGRTGRMGRQGQAVTLLAPDDMVKWRRLERGFTRPIPRVPWRGAKALLANGHTNGNGKGNGHAADVTLAAPATTTQRPATARPAARSTQRRADTTTPRQSTTSKRDPVGRSARPAPRETEPELNGRELLRRYGRDPRRPAWADAERGHEPAAAPTARGEAEPRARRRHQSVCAACGQTAETSFRPDPSRPVYCDGCYRERREQRRPTVAAS